MGIWNSASENDSFWTSVFNELNTRSVKDILIACHDNLSGFSSALETVFPKTEKQLCVIHMIRNTTKYVSYKEIKPIMADLKKVYTAPNEEAALFALEELREKWESKYPQMLKVWDDNWAEVSTFFKYPEEVRRLIIPPTPLKAFTECFENSPKQGDLSVIGDSEFLKKSRIESKFFTRDRKLSFACVMA